ncbi:MAG: DUF3052 domain-containing protein [Armatimonadetes bacterium]|nr:DUF3052 domain-containing protein [Armatimonadota bacterium]
MQSAGYSGTPLVQKLGIKPGVAVHALDAPPHYEELLDPLPDGAHILRDHLSGPSTFIHLFASERAKLEQHLEGVIKNLEPTGILWISWPKKASGVPTDITEDVLRTVCLPTGLVDVKVCAVDATWSGLKFYWRNELR